MDRLNFRIPEFVRIAWVSAEAQKVWEPIIQKSSNFFSYLERFNRNAIVSIKPEELIGHPLRPVPLYQTNVAKVYQAGASTFDPAQPWEYRCAIGPNSEQLALAHAREDWIKVGRLLNYPECCIQFFQKYWVEEGWFDTTFSMGKGSMLSSANNILLRWVGIRLVSHLPCAFNCFGTMQIGDRNIQLARELEYNEEIDYLIEMLSWPVEWSSLHGIAVITTPIFKIITASDALPIKVSFKLEGIKYPREAGSGIVFPFLRAQVDNHIANGFTDKQSMDESHGRILLAVEELKPRSVLDLGCGNGLLLNKIADAFGASTYGVDCDRSKAPDACMDLYDFDFSRKFDLVLIAEQRLKENPKRAEVLLTKIANNAKYLCIYNYNTGIIRVETFNGKTPVIN